MTCSMLNCKGEACWEPVILLWAYGHDPVRHQPASLTIHGAKVCDLCKSRATIDDYLSETTIKRIKTTFFIRKKAIPDVERAKIVYFAPGTISIGGERIFDGAVT